MRLSYAPFILSLLFISITGWANTQSENPPCNANIITEDQEVCDNFFMIAADAPEIGETGEWGIPTGTGIVNINAPETIITSLNPGPNILTWTIFDSNGIACSVAELVLINSEVETTPAILTENNTEVCDENGFQVEADGPLLPGEIGFWSSDNGQVTFTNPNALTTIANNLVPGNNVIFWNITNNTCDANPASITVTNNEVVTPAQIEIFSATTTCETNGTDNIYANITTPLVPGEFGMWTGPAGVVFDPVDAEAPTIYNLLPGDNMLIWTIGRGNCPVNADTLILTNNDPANVNINLDDSDTAACPEDALNLSADAPLAGQTGVWTGPTGAVFAPDATSPNVSVTNTPSGTHYFYWTLTQANCERSDSIQVEIFDGPTSTYEVIPTSTVGGNEGEIDICVEGGTSPFNILWSPLIGGVAPTNDPDCPGESFNISSLTANSYTVTITDANGCTDILGDNSEPGDTITVGGPDCSDFDFGVVSSTNESCNENQDGTITIEVLNPQGSVLFSVGNANGIQDVSSFDNPFTFENLPAGEYNLFITDERLCTDSYIGNPIIITEPDPVTVSTVQTGITTLDGEDGTISVCINGGTAPYAVVWSPNTTGSVSPNTGVCDDNQIITGLAQGNYDVTVTDANGCTFNINDITINEPICDISLPLDGVTSTNASCNGANDGTITIAGMTDSEPLVYSIDGGMTYMMTNTFEDLEPGTYQVFIQDSQLCTDGPIEVTITEPATLEADVSIINVSTVGGADGQIRLCLEGGTPDYEVIWSPAIGNLGPVDDPNCNGESLAISGLSADEYVVTITDANGCTEILGDNSEPGDEIVIEEPACDYTINVNAADNSCGVNPNNESYDGIIEVEILGDAPGPFTIDIGCGVEPITTEFDTHIFTGLEPCNYVIQVTAADGCIFGYSENPVLIDAPEPLSAPFIITETTTVNSEDGEICVNPTGGTAPYTVTICNQIAQMGGACDGFFVGGLMVGDTCQVLVEDDKGCQSTGTLFISGPDCSAFTAELNGMDGATGSCDDTPTGSINLDVFGGVEPYTFTWSNGATTEDLTDLEGGIYSVTVTDAVECETFLDAIEIETFPPIDLEIGVTIDGVFTPGNEFELTDGPIQLGFEAGVEIVSAIWSPAESLDDPTSLTPIANPSETTIYTVIVTTAEGCTATAEITIKAQTIVVVPDGFTPNGDDTNEEFFPVVIGNAEILSFSVWNRWGEKLHDDPNNGWDGTYKNTAQPLSTYVYVIEYRIANQDSEVLKGDFVLLR